MATGDEQLQAEVLHLVLDAISSVGWDSSPPTLAQTAHSIVRRKLGADPYVEAKRRQNAHALSLYDHMKEEIALSSDPLTCAFKVAIAGNVMDFGPKERVDFGAALDQCISSEITLDESGMLKDSLAEATSVLYLLDNAGEVVCDRAALETIIEKCPSIEIVTVVCKGGPILNDAMYEDVMDSGLGDLPKVRIIATGNGEPNTGLVRSSHAFRKLCDSHDVVISKGQGNYEELSDRDDIFFLLKAKCALIARDAKVAVGSMICGRKR